MKKTRTVHPDATKRLLSIADVAERCRVSEKTIRRWIAVGDLAAHKLGRQWRISEDDLRRFMRDRWHG